MCLCMCLYRTKNESLVMRELVGNRILSPLVLYISRNYIWNLRAGFSNLCSSILFFLLKDFQEEALECAGYFTVTKQHIFPSSLTASLCYEPTPAPAPSFLALPSAGRLELPHPLNGTAPSFSSGSHNQGFFLQQVLASGQRNAPTPPSAPRGGSLVHAKC